MYLDDCVYFGRSLFSFHLLLTSVIHLKFARKVAQVKYILLKFDNPSVKCNRFDVRQEGREMKRESFTLRMG